MYRELKKIEFPKEYCILIWNQQEEIDQEIDGKKKYITERNGRSS
jgi:hypothetical protein